MADRRHPGDHLRCDKDGESVTLEADTLEQMELLIALREGNVKPEDQPRAAITMPDSFRVLLDRHEQKQYEYEFPLLDNCGNDLQERIVHQLVDDLARALVDAKREGGANNETDR